MVYDPAWDMPRVNWVQQGSFEAGEIPPDSDPDAGTLICLPPINEVWLPFILGCLDQMNNPSSWLVADDDAMYATLTRVAKLRQMLGKRAECFMYELRFTGSCVLQFSIDGGTTWADVAGWDAYYPTCNPPQTVVRYTADCALQQSFDGAETFTTISGWGAYWCGCVQACVPIIGLPPNPGDQAPDQLACSIASYLANEVILNAMSAAVTAIQDDLTLLSFGANILNIIPEFILVRLGYDAVAIIYTAIAEGTLSDFEAALTDTALWADITCAIYTAILGDGYVTPGNYAAVMANIEALTFAHADVKTAVVDYLTSLGAVGLAQLSQRGGLVAGADCSACGGWCAHFNFALSSGSWTLDGGEGIYNAGHGIDSTGPIGPWEALTIATGGWDSSQTVTTVRVVGNMANTAPSGVRYVTNSVGNTTTLTHLAAGPLDETVAFPYTDNNLSISLYSNYNGTGSRLTDVYISGTGTNPFLSRYGTGVTDC